MWNPRSSVSQLGPRDHDPEMGGALEIGSPTRGQREVPEAGEGSRSPGEASAKAVM